MAWAYSRQDRIYLQTETTWGTIPNSTGAATVAGTNYCRLSKVSLDPVTDLYPVTYKTGVRGMAPGIKGRQYGKWSYSGPLIPSGNGTTAPDLGPILTALFGAAPTIAGGAIPYVLSDTIKSFTMYRWRGPLSGNTLNNQVGFGCVVSTATFSIGQNFADFTASGESLWVLDTEQYTAGVTDGDAKKGGFTTAGQAAYPSEPGTQTANGTPVYGFVGSFKEGGSQTVMANIQNVSINVATGNQLIRDTFGTFTPSGVMGDTRKVGISLGYYDSDDQAMKDVRAASLSKAGVDLIVAVGNTQYNTITFTMKGIQFETPTTDDSGPRFKQSVAESTAHPSALTTTDEFAMTIS